MRVFCLVHNRGFSAPRKNPVRCENRTHVLGEMDFEGQATQPAELRWEYCCNCEHFWPVGVDQKAAEQCPVCKRKVSLRYLCNRCYTLSVESLNAVKVKNFTLTTDGVPEPSCPCCLAESPATVSLRNHQCHDLNASYKTTLAACPVCKELIGDVPSFPIPLSEYFIKVRADKKVTWDFLEGMFVPADGGEFVLVPNGSGTNRPIVLPEMTRFTTKQDFYTYYENSFHCDSPSAGEVVVVYPAVVEKVEGGWKLRDVGRLEVRGDPAGLAKETIPATNLLFEKSGQTKSKTIKGQEDKSVPVCSHCGATPEPGTTYCWNCGKPLAEESSPSKRTPTPPVLPVVEEQNAPTPQPIPAPFYRALFETAPSGVESSSTGAGAWKWLLPLVAVFVLGVIGVIIWLWLPALSSSNTNSVNGSAAAAKQGSGNTAAQAATQSPEDNELKGLKERLSSVSPSERPKLLADLESAEGKYPNDYRFSYERAKYVVVGTREHHEAFEALFLAGQKAIDSGKANEMLNDLTRDKEGDFYKLAQGHAEWKILIAALTNKDKSALKTRPHK